MSSSVRAKMAVVQKEQNRATEEGIKQQDDKQQHSQAAVGGAPAEAGGSDSPKPSGEVKAKAKATAKKVVKKKTVKKG